MIEESGERTARRQLGARWWLILHNGAGRPEPLVVGRGRGAAVAVFSFEEEAEMFLRFGGLSGGGWQIRGSRAGDLISVLTELGDGVAHVALDPLPQMLADETAGLVSVSRKHFVEGLLSRYRRGSS